MKSDKWINEFFLKDIMVIYLHEELGFDMDISTALFHVCDVLTFVIPTFAAIIAGNLIFETKMCKLRKKKMCFHLMTLRIENCFKK